MDRNSALAPKQNTAEVALRKESVDRNLIDEIQLEFNSLSLSARRAWIEILYQLYDTYAKVRRSPQGERG